MIIVLVEANYGDVAVSCVEIQLPKGKEVIDWS